MRLRSECHFIERSEGGDAIAVVGGFARAGGRRGEMTAKVARRFGVTRPTNAIRSLGRRCVAIEADVFSRIGCESLVRTALKACFRIDILVSNPAFSRRSGFLEVSPENFERTINGTLISGFHMSQLVARHMVDRDGGGKIVFMSSVQAEMPIRLCAAYGAAKAGLNHMMRSIAVEGKRLPWGRLGLPQDIVTLRRFWPTGVRELEWTLWLRLRIRCGPDPCYII